MMDELPSPRTNARLIGHEAALEQLVSQWKGGKLHHGWLICGPRGSGKATLAYHFARMLLSGKEQVGEGSPVFARVAAGSHTDLLVVEPLFNEKKDEYANDISVEQARQIPQFLSLTAGESEWRVVIIDAVDQLNVNGANAILKILEEPPPKSVILLVCHNPSKLLPTIRSRCQVLKVAPMNRESCVSVLKKIAPDLDPEQLGALAMLSGNSPGVALELKMAGAVSLYEGLLNLCALLPEIDSGELYGFAESIMAGAMHANWRTLTQMMLTLLHRAAQLAAGQGDQAISPEEELILPRLAALHPPAVWAEKYQQAAEQFSLAERLHLDYKQVLIVFIHSLASREGLQLGILAA